LRKFRPRSCRALLLHIPKESGGPIGSREKIMQKKRVLSLILALSCTAALLGGCAGSDTSDDNAASGEHEVITMNAPYRNMSQFYDLVHEKYPEINLEIIPYNGENTSSYMKDMRLSGELPDIYSTTYYTPSRTDDEGDFLDLSGYDFMDNYTPSRLRDVSYNGGIYMLPMGYSAIGITYNKTLLDANGWTLPTNLD
jgi:raffinose/stachyose/melibiose transport system substrate-binding protein